MYTNHAMMFELAKAKQRDLLVQAETHRRVRQARQGTGAADTRASRRGRRAWQLLQPLRAHAHAQS